jgi:T5SS/PEP-CTERM-associated repeat protein/autotransporter-associated beta strand protein
LTIGGNGDGALTLSSGGNVTSSSFASVALNAGSNGMVSVTGANSTLSANGISVGNSGNGSLTVGSGGAVTVTPQGLNVGVNNGSNGSLTISSGGNVTTSNNTLVALNGGSTGAISVSGANSVLATNGLGVGGSGNGTLTIAGGGNVTSSNNTLVGLNSGSNGAASVTGGNSVLNTGTLTVGNNGNGNLTIASGGTVTETNGPATLGLFNGSNGVLNLDAGGTLQVVNLQAGNGSYAFNWGGGTLRPVGGNFAASLNASLVPDSTPSTFDTNGFSAQFSGNLTGAGALEIIGAGVLTLTGNNAYSGGTILNAGTLDINSASAIGTGLFTINGGAIRNNSGADLTLTTNNAQDWNGSFTFDGNRGINFGDGPVALNANITITTVNGAGGGGHPLTIGGNISGPFSLTENGATGPTVALAGNNTYTGGTTLNSGILAIDSPTALGTGPLTINGGNIDNNSGAGLTLSGNNSQFWNGNFTYNGSDTLNLGTGPVVLGANVTVTTNGGHELTEGGNISGAFSLTKNGTGTGIPGGELTVSGNNTYTGGTNVLAGALVVTGAGTLGNPASTTFVQSGAELDISNSTAGVTTSTLANNGTVALGAENLTVGTDYTNPNFGVGNSFNPHANVTGTGEILAGGGTSLALGGNASGSTLAFGNVHVGTNNTLAYTVGNGGPGGAALLRGAVQTSVNGGNLTDARLSGAGVTPANFGPLSGGQSGSSLGVSFNAASAGPLLGQVAHVESNFDNVFGNLTITGAAYRYAAPQVTPANVTFGNAHQGSLIVQWLTLLNNAINDNYSEDMDADFGGTTGSVSANGSLSLLAPGASNSTALSLTLDTSSAGVKSGTATVNLTSDGAGTSGLGNTALTPQTVDITGNVYRYAAANTLANVSFGNVHQGDTLQQSLSVTNLAANDGFSESLDGSISGSSGAASGSGAFSLLAPGATNSTALGVSFNSTLAGVQNGTVTVSFVSDGTGTSGLGNTALTPQTFNITGNVYLYAAVNNLPPTVNFGIVHVGDAVSQNLTVTNTAPATGGFTENLGATFGTVGGGLIENGSVTGLGAGNSSNALLVTLDTTNAGNLTSSPVQVRFMSQALVGTGLGNTMLPSQTVDFSAQINNYADPTYSQVSGPGNFTIVTPEVAVLDFGNVSVGAANVTTQMSVANAAAAPADWLDGNITFSNASGEFVLAGLGNFTGMQAGDNQDFTIQFLTDTPGAYNGTIFLAATSQNSGGYSGNLGVFELQVEGTVVVPEPAAAALLFAAGALLLAGVATRSARNRRTKPPSRT